MEDLDDADMFGGKAKKKDKVKKAMKKKLDDTKAVALAKALD